MKQVKLILIAALFCLANSSFAKSSQDLDWKHQLKQNIDDNYFNTAKNIRDVDAIICEFSNQFCDLEYLPATSPTSREPLSKTMDIITEHEVMYGQVKEYLWPKMRVERNSARYKELYDVFEQVSIGQAKLIDLKVTVRAIEF